MENLSRFDVREDETLEELGRGGLKIIQKRRGFRFGTDSILLADFVPRMRGHIGDFGTGSAILPLLMSDNLPTARFTAWEVQTDIADMARRTVVGNGLEARINVICGDVRDALKDVGSGALDALICNPPYYSDTAGGVSPDESRRVARNAGEALDEWMMTASKAVKWGGRAFFVYPAVNSIEMISMLRAHGFEPKRLRFVHGRASKAARLVLIDAVRGAHVGVNVMPPLILEKEDGNPTDEYIRIYRL